MGDLARKGIVGLMIIVVVMIGMDGAECKLHKVGARGWIPNYNYTEWLNQQDEHFYVGDWLCMSLSLSLAWLSCSFFCHRIKLIVQFFLPNC